MCARWPSHRVPRAGVRLKSRSRSHVHPEDTMGGDRSAETRGADRQPGGKHQRQGKETGTSWTLYISAKLRFSRGTAWGGNGGTRNNSGGPGADQGVQGLRRRQERRPEGPAPHHPCADRAQRRGQDDLLQPAHPLPDADGAAASCSTAATSPALRRRQSLAWGWRGRSRSRRCFRTCRCARTCASRCSASCGNSFYFWRSETRARQARTRARSSWSRRSASPRSPSSRRSICPTAASARWRSPPRSRSIPR